MQPLSQSEGGHKRPLFPPGLLGSGPRSRARLAMHARINRRLDAGARGLLTGAMQAWLDEPRHLSHHGRGGRLESGGPPLLVLGLARASGAGGTGGPFVVLAAERGGPGGPLLDWRATGSVDDSSAPALPLVRHCHGLAARLQARTEGEVGGTASSQLTPGLALTNPLPGLQLVLGYYGTCQRLFSPREQRVLEVLRQCSWPAQAAMALLLSLGPLAHPSRGGKGLGRSAGGVDAEIAWALLDLLEAEQQQQPQRQVQTLDRHGPVQALRLPLLTGSQTMPRPLRELEDHGLVRLGAMSGTAAAHTYQHQHQQHGGGGCGWLVPEEVETVVARLAFLYTGAWELVEEEDEDPESDASAGRPPRMAATLALLGEHALGLFASTAGASTDSAAPAPQADAEGGGLAPLFVSRDDLERVLRARGWRCRVAAAMCEWPTPAAAMASATASSKRPAGSSSSSRGVVALLEEVVCGLRNGGAGGVSLRHYVKAAVTREAGARRESYKRGRTIAVTETVYTSTWQWARGLFAGASWLRRKGGDVALSALLFELLLYTTDLVCYTAGIRREAWTALIKAKWVAVSIRSGADRERACEDLLDTYEAALEDYMQPLQGGDRLAAERGVQTLRALMLKWDMEVDTSTRAGAQNFDIPAGSYRDVFVEAVQEPRRPRTEEEQRSGSTGRLVFEGGRNVEEVALAAYERLGYRGLFTECRLYKTLLRLLLWDEVMDPTVAGAFACPLLTTAALPLDVDHGHMFYLRREAAIEARLAALKALARERKLGAEVARAWDRHWLAVSVGDAGSCAVGGGGRWFCPGLTRQAAVEVAVGLAQCGLLCLILGNLAKDPGAWSRGLPDLIVWAPASQVKGSLPLGGKTVGTAAALNRLQEYGDPGPTTPFATPSKGDAEAAAAWLDGGEGQWEGEQGGGASSSSAAAVPSEDVDIVVKLVEVKSRADFLSDYQLAWISLFVRHAVVVGEEGAAGKAGQQNEGDGGEVPPRPRRCCPSFELCHVRSLMRA